MIKLYGIPVSNYFSTAKAAFIEKGVPFEEVTVMPGEDPAVVALSPMGKVPYIEVDGRPLCETNVIFEYLEETKPEPSLYPGDAWERAKARELVRAVELYLDAPARRLLPQVYFGQPVDERTRDEVRPLIEKGLGAFLQLARFDPYAAGGAFTYADISAYFQVRFTNLHTTAIYGWDLIADTPDLAAYLELVGKRPSVEGVDRVMQAGLEGFLPK